MPIKSYIKKTDDSTLTHGIIAAAEELGVRDGIAEVRSDDVEAESLGQFVRHHYPVLEDRDREDVGGGGVTRQPQSEVAVCVCSGFSSWKQSTVHR